MQKEINIIEIQIIIMGIILYINDLITVKDDKNLTQCCQDINERYNKILNCHQIIQRGIIRLQSFNCD